MDPRQAIYMSCIIAGANAAFTVVALVLIDRIGRRPLLLYTLPGVALGLASLGFTFFAQHSSNDALNTLPIGVMAMLSMTVYIGFFASGK
jgi:MFS family permease